MNSINKLAEHYNLPIIYSLHPRSEKFIKERGFEFHANVKKIKPLGFIDYINLQMNSYCVISDSGTLAEESAILNIPSVSLRTSTERPEAIDKGKMIISGLKFTNIAQSIELATKIKREIK